MIKLTYRPRRAAKGAGSPRPRRQGDHVRLRRDQPEAERSDARGDEDGHVGRRRRAGDDVGARRRRLSQRRHRVPDVHRQHAVGIGDEARRRAAHPRRQDRRGAQHRCRGPSRPRRRPRPRRRGGARRDHRHRHPDRRRPGRPRNGLRRRARQQPGADRPGARRRRCHRRAGVAAPAGDQALPQAARLRRRRPQEHRQPVRRHDHRRGVPQRVRRRRPVGPPRHRPDDEGRRRRVVALQGGHGLRHPPAHRRWRRTSPSPS